MEYPTDHPAWLYAPLETDEERLRAVFAEKRRRPLISYPAIGVIAMCLSAAVSLAAIAFLILLLMGWEKPAAAQVLPVEQYDAIMTARLMTCIPGPGKIAPRREMAERIASEYQETKTSALWLSPWAVAELYVNREGGTWTIVRVDPAGMACVVAAGHQPPRPHEDAA